MSRLGLCVASALLALLASCSTSPPQIVETFWQVTLVHDRSTNASYERLSLFLHVSLPDGLSDLDSIYLLNDAAELYWKLDPVNWVSSDENGELWVGSNRIEMPDRSDLPRGRYRIILSNLAGERALGEIFVSAGKLDPTTAPFPAASVAHGEISVHSSLSNESIRVYDSGGRLVGARAIQDSPVAVSSLVPAGLRGSAYLIYAYGYDKSCGCGLLSGPW